MTIIQVNAASEIANDYVTYATLTANRSIPQVIDGLKTVQRRIIQSAFEQHLWHDQPFKKVSRLDGYVLGNYHAQGSAASAIINLCDASDFLQPLLQGHGCLGGWSIDTRQKISNDAPASSRYLEAKLSAFSQAVFDIDIKYLKIRPNYDGTRTEIAEYVPALPLALINAQSGIGTGWACNSVGFPVKNIIKALSSEPQNYSKYLGVPDFPFNTNIVKNEELVKLHEEGRASITLQGEWHVEAFNTGGKRNADREALIITKIANGNAESLLDQIKECHENGKLEGIANLIDETSKDIRIVIVCKKDIKAESLLPSLLKYTNLSSKYSAKFTCINSLLPKEFTPSEILSIWLEARKSVLLRKYSDELAQTQNTLLLKEGLYKVFPNLKNIALLIMEAETVDEARLSISNKYKCTNDVAESILQIQLKKLTKLSKSQLELEIQSLKEQVIELQKLTTNAEYLHSKIIELAKLAAKHCCSRVSPVIPGLTPVVIEPIVNSNINKTKTRNPGELSTKAYNKAKKKYFDKVSYTYCKNINDLIQALEDGRHELEDILIKDAIKKSEVKRKNGKLCKPLTERDFTKAMNRGTSASARLKEHIDYWQNK